MKKIVLFFVFLILFFSPYSKVNADTQTMDVYPSYYKSIDIVKGTSKSYEINIRNSSKITNDKNNVPIKVLLSGFERKSSESNTSSLIVNNWLSINKKEFDIKVGEISKVDFTINVPKDVVEGEHILILDIKNNTTISSSDGVDISPSIQVPIIINVLHDANQTNNLIEDASVSLDADSDILKLSEDVSFLNKIKNSLFKKNQTDGFLISGDTFNFEFGKNTIVLYNPSSTEKVFIKDVLIKNSDTNTRYVKVPIDIDKNKSIQKIVFKSNEMHLLIDNKDFIVDLKNEAIANTIENQITEMVTNKKFERTYNWILENIKVPKYLNSKELSFISYCKIKNTGTKTLLPEGIMEAYDTNNNSLSDVRFGSSLISPYDTKILTAKINSSDLKYIPSSVVIKNVVSFGNNAKKIEFSNNIKIINQNYVIFFILLIILFLFLIVYIIQKKNKFLFRKKNY